MICTKELAHLKYNNLKKIHFLHKAKLKWHLELQSISFFTHQGCKLKTWRDGAQAPNLTNSEN
jgi:hypothetical protein